VWVGAGGSGIGRRCGSGHLATLSTDRREKSHIASGSLTTVTSTTIPATGYRYADLVFAASVSSAKIPRDGNGSVIAFHVPDPPNLDRSPLMVTTDTGEVFVAESGDVFRCVNGNPARTILVFFRPVTPQELDLVRAAVKNALVSALADGGSSPVEARAWLS
jgi:hypothetical protein